MPVNAQNQDYSDDKEGTLRIQENTQRHKNSTKKEIQTTRKPIKVQYIEKILKDKILLKNNHVKKSNLSVNTNHSNIYPYFDKSQTNGTDKHNWNKTEGYKLKLTDPKMDTSDNNLNRSIFLQRKFEKTTKANETGNVVHTILNNEV